jgi:hypothetical protein
MKLWTEKVEELVHDIPDDFLGKMAQYKFEILWGLCNLISVEAQLYVEKKERKKMRNSLA